VEQTPGLGDFLPSLLMGTAMATRSVSDYEAALDDITRRGVSAMRDTQRTVEDAVSSAADVGRDALDSAGRARDSVANAILHSIKVRPYTTLAIAGFIGFVYGAMRR
jgi:ElaB/YqjD/DUF883 family membrane-anchored ribosome-binding protein